MVAHLVKCHCKVRYLIWNNLKVLFMVSELKDSWNKVYCILFPSQIGRPTYQHHEKANMYFLHLIDYDRLLQKKLVQSLREWRILKCTGTEMHLLLDYSMSGRAESLVLNEWPVTHLIRSAQNSEALITRIWVCTQLSAVGVFLCVWFS